MPDERSVESVTRRRLFRRTISTRLLTSLVEESLLDEVALRPFGVELVPYVLDSILNRGRHSHGLLDVLRTRPDVFGATVERFVEPLENVIAIADPDADSGTAGVICHTHEQTCKAIKPCESGSEDSNRVTMMNEPLREQMKVGQGFAREQRRRV